MGWADTGWLRSFAATRCSVAEVVGAAAARSQARLSGGVARSRPHVTRMSPQRGGPSVCGAAARGRRGPWRRRLSAGSVMACLEQGLVGGDRAIRVDSGPVRTRRPSDGATGSPAPTACRPGSARKPDASRLRPVRTAGGRGPARHSPDDGARTAVLGRGTRTAAPADPDDVPSVYDPSVYDPSARDAERQVRTDVDVRARAGGPTPRPALRRGWEGRAAQSRSGSGSRFRSRSRPSRAFETTSVAAGWIQ